MNGTIGKVTEFLTASEASGRGYRIGIPAPDPDKDKEEETVEPWRNGRKKPQQKRRESYLPDNTERYMNSMEKYPLVYFPVGHLGSGQGVHVLCIPTTFDVNNSKGKIEAMRTQVSSSIQIYNSVLSYIYMRRAGTLDFGLGFKYPQESRANASESAC